MQTSDREPSAGMQCDVICDLLMGTLAYTRAHCNCVMHGC
jgi:hypothetical protein